MAITAFFIVGDQFIFASSDVLSDVEPSFLTIKLSMPVATIFYRERAVDNILYVRRGNIMDFQGFQATFA